MWRGGAEKVNQLGNQILPGLDGNFKYYMEAGKQVKKLLMSSGEALSRLAADEVIKSALPGEMYQVYMWYKQDEWERFLATVSNWDVGTYLDCLP